MRGWGGHSGTLTGSELPPPQNQGARGGGALMRIWQELQQENLVGLPTAAGLLGAQNRPCKGR